MELPGLFTTKPEVTPEKQYLAIVLTEHSVQSALWKVTNGEIVIIKRSKLHAFDNEKDCIVKTDESLQDLGQESEAVSQVVFGLQPSWVKGDDVSSERQKLLDKITTELTLDAVGFVVITEAVIQHSLHVHPNVSALFIHLSAELLSVILVSQGKAVQAEHVGRSNDTVADVTEAFARVQSKMQPAQPFPAKFFIFSGDLNPEELIKEEQTLIDQDWLDRGFLQPPVTEVLSPVVILDSVVSQGGKVVAAVEGMLPDSSSPSSVDTDAEFGFDEVKFAGKDDLATSDADTQPTNTLPTPEDANVVPFEEERAVPTGSSFGVPVTGATTNQKDELDEPTDSKSSKGKFKFPAIALPSFIKTLKLPNLDLSGKDASGKKRKPHPYIIAGFILGLVVLLSAGYFYLKFTATAVIAITLKTQAIAKVAEITLDPKATIADPEKLVLPASITTKSIESSATAPASGVTLVGEKAKGKITLLNKTTSPKTFSSGTTVSNGKFQFTLDEEVTIASASVKVSGSSETKEYGQKEVNVTAKVIGAESNLAKDTELAIESFSSNTYSARAPEAFTGGSSREVRVVSQEDRTKLLAQVRADILKKAEEAFKSESGNGAYTLPTGTMTITQTTFNAEVGDEEDELSLTVIADVEAMSYNQDDLKPLAAEILKSEVPEGYELSDKVPDIMSDPAESASGSSMIKLNVNLSSQAKPIVFADNWKDEIVGLGLDTAKSKLRSKGEIQEVRIMFHPTIVEKLIPVIPAAARITIETK